MSDHGRMELVKLANAEIGRLDAEIDRLRGINKELVKALEATDVLFQHPDDPVESTIAQLRKEALAKAGEEVS